MPETDVSKMKVADLKRELKLRGLTTTGNKTELQDRLQTALIDGELSLEDTAISGEELLDESVLTDEDEAKILGADENELLKSPSATPIADAPLLISPLKTGAAALEDDVLESPTTPTAGGRKIVLKRKCSITAPSATVTTAKENTEPVPAKTVKLSLHKPIVMSSEKQEKVVEATTEANAATAKVAQLSLQERLELRAKKFGINANATTATAAGKTATANNVISGGASDVTDEKQIELLKKRAERFGCVVSSKIAKIDAEERLLKRKQRFGGSAVEASAATTDAETTDVWAEKARLRLERFKSSATTTAASSN